MLMTSPHVSGSWFRRVGFACVVLSSTLVLNGCESLDDDALFGATRPLPESQRNAPNASAGGVMVDNQADAQPKTEIFEGDNKFVNTVQRPRSSMKGGDVVLDFADAEIKDALLR
jgi:hypothetical protein